MKKILYLLLPVTLILSSCEKNDEGTNPANPVDIPDPVFLELLIDEGVDSNSDGIISRKEAEAVKELVIDDIDLSTFAPGEPYPDVYLNDLTGIEAFTNLIYLRLNNHPRGWYIKDLESIDLSKNILLEELECRWVGLKNINITGLKKLQYIDLGDNELSSLNVTECNNLRELGCDHNKIDNLDLSNCPKLRILHCYGNQLPQLDLSVNSELSDLICGDNNLETLNISGQYWLLRLVISDMPSLKGVCVYTDPYPPISAPVIVNREGSPNVYFTADCSK